MATDPRPTHVFADNGVYIVTLTVTDERGNTASDTLQVTVKNVAPTAGRVRAGHGRSRANPDLRPLDADASAVDRAGTFTYAIDWGDGSAVQSVRGTAGVAVDHVFTTAATFTAKITATDKDGGTSLPVTRVITIGAVEMQGSTLAVGGTTGGDNVVVKADATGALTVTINGVNQGTFRADRANPRLCPGGGRHRPARQQQGEGHDLLRHRAGGSGRRGRQRHARHARQHGRQRAPGRRRRDSLLAGAGNDLLVGGLGADVLRGGDGDDILVGGTTDFDANPTALSALMAEWGRTDLTYQARIDHLSGTTTGGRNGAYLLNALTVHTEEAVDQLYGENGIDWFFYDPTSPGADVLKDRKSNEQVKQL